MTELVCVVIDLDRAVSQPSVDCVQIVLVCEARQIGQVARRYCLLIVQTF